MKKGEILEGIVEKIDFPNKGKMLFRDRKSVLPFIKSGGIR